MGNVRRFAVTLGIALSGWALASPAAAEPPTAEGKATKSAAAPAKDERSTKQKLADRRETRKRFRSKHGPTSEQKLEKRRERLERAAKKLRERAASLREQAEAAGADDKKAKRLSERATKFEAQAKRMDERSKTIGTEEAARPARATRRDPKAGRNRLRGVRRAQLRRRWGRVLSSEEALAELRQHSRRSAKLKRIRKLARRAKNDKAAERAAKLLALEKKRHERRMAAIQATIPGAAAPAKKASGAEANENTTAGAKEASQ